jgi:hypothetical protein
MLPRRFLSLILLLLCLPFAPLTAADSVEAKMLHNEGWFTHDQFRRNHAEFDRTIAEMNALRQQTGSPVFATAAKLIGDLDRRMTRGNDAVRSLVDYYKHRWNQKHYQNMDKKWKDDTYAKHKAKIVSLQVLMQHLSAAYNDWNAARNALSGVTDGKKVKAAIQTANDTLSKALDAAAAAEAETFSALESELAAAKRKR